MTEAAAITSDVIGANNRIVGVLEKADRRNAGHQIMQQRYPLGPEFTDEHVEARQVASRTIVASDEAELHRIDADGEHSWDVSGRSLSRESRRRSGCDDHSHSKSDQITHQRRQPVSLVSSPAIFDR